MPSLSLEAIEERLAKAKEDVEFLERARALFFDPRSKAISAPESEPMNVPPACQAPPMPRAYGELKSKVYEVLPAVDADGGARLTTQQIVARLLGGGYVFMSKDPIVAVNGALVALEGQGLARNVGKRGKARLWRRDRPQTKGLPKEPPRH